MPIRALENNVRDISNATADYFKISGVRYSWLHSNSQYIDLCFEHRE
jgi:hypothetical protein